MLSKKMSLSWCLLAVSVLSFALLSGCSSSDQSGESAVPSFCPTNYARDLPVPLALTNTPPRAYYQRVSTTVGTELDITLLACDPDYPLTAAGMSWQIMTPLTSGVQLFPLSGTYSTQRTQVTYFYDQIGIDTFTYQVMDAEGATSNLADIQVVVTLPPVTSQQLFFGGYDDSDVYNLWTYDGTSPIQAIPGSATGMSAIGMKQVLEGLPYNDKIYFIGTDASSEFTYLFSFDSMSGQFELIPESFAAGYMEIYNSLLYVSVTSGIGATPTYLWSTNGSGSWSTVPGSADLFPSYLTPYNSKLYFAGGQGVDGQVWSYDNSGSILTTETSIGSDLRPRDLAVCNGKLHFNGRFGAAAPYEYLWSMDGSSAATTVTNSVTSPENMICYNNELYFTAKGAPGSTMPVQLWSLSDTDVLTRWTSNTTADFMGTYSDTYPVVLGPDLYMRGNDDAYTNWIWAHDGSSALTTVSGSDGLYPFETTTFDDRLFFRSNAPLGYYQLWSYDPVTDNLVQMSNMTMGLNPKGFTVYP